MLNESVTPTFYRQSCPWFHVHVVKNERLMCEIKVPLGYYSTFINIIRRNYTRSYDIQIFSYPDIGVILDKYLFSRGRKLADADPTGTLDS